MTTSINNQKEERKNIGTVSLHSKRVTWNSKRKYNYRYVTSVF